MNFVLHIFCCYSWKPLILVPKTSEFGHFLQIINQTVRYQDLASIFFLCVFRFRSLSHETKLVFNFCLVLFLRFFTIWLRVATPIRRCACIQSANVRSKRRNEHRDSYRYLTIVNNVTHEIICNSFTSWLHFLLPANARLRTATKRTNVTNFVDK